MASVKVLLNKRQKNETIDRLMEASAPSVNFWLMMILSTFIVTLGLLIDNLSVIIGGMMVTPLLSPLLSFAMGVVVYDYKLIMRSIWLIIESIILITFIAVVITLLSIERDMVSTLALEAKPSFEYLLISLFSGGTVAYAIAHPSLSDTLPGIAMSVALLSPLAALGIGLSFFQWEIIARSANLFILNISGIILSAIFVFAFMDFKEAKSEITKNIKEEKMK